MASAAHSGTGWPALGGALRGDCSASSLQRQRWDQTDETPGPPRFSRCMRWQSLSQCDSRDFLNDLDRVTIMALLCTGWAHPPPSRAQPVTSHTVFLIPHGHAIILRPSSTLFRPTAAPAHTRASHSCCQRSPAHSPASPPGRGGCLQFFTMVNSRAHIFPHKGLTGAHSFLGPKSGNLVQAGAQGVSRVSTVSHCKRGSFVLKTRWQRGTPATGNHAL